MELCWEDGRRGQKGCVSGEKRCENELKHHLPYRAVNRSCLKQNKKQSRNSNRRMLFRDMNINTKRNSKNSRK